MTTGVLNLAAAGGTLLTNGETLTAGTAALSAANLNYTADVLNNRTLTATATFRVMQTQTFTPKLTIVSLGTHNRYGGHED